MSIRFLATGDIHCGNYSQFNYTQSEGMGSRLFNTLQVFDIILNEAKRRNINKVLLNGDTFNDSTWVETEVFDAVYMRVEAMHTAGLDVVMNVGNHDVSKVSKGGMLHSLRPFRKIAQIIEKPTIVWKHLIVVPWMPDPEEFKDVLSGLRPSLGLALHYGIQGAVTGPKKVLVKNQVQLADIRPNIFNMILLSDYHTTQTLAPDVFYMGSPLQHNFGEQHTPGIWEIKLSDKSGCLATLLPTNLPKFLAVSPRGLFDIESLFTHSPGNYFRITLPPNSKIHSSDIEALAQRYKCQVQIVHESDVVANPGDPSPKVVETVKAFKSFVRSNIKSKSKRKRLLKVGNRLYGGEIG